MVICDSVLPRVDGWIGRGFIGFRADAGEDADWGGLVGFFFGRGGFGRGGAREGRVVVDWGWGLWGLC